MAMRDITGVPPPVKGTAAGGAGNAAAHVAQIAAYDRGRDYIGAGLLVVLGLLGVFLPNLGASSYLLTITYFGAFYVGVGQSWNLISGYTGYLSIAHGAFVGIGAYMAIISINAGLPWVVAILAGVVSAGFVAVLLGTPAIRLSKLAFAFATLFFTEIVRRVVLLADDVFGGPSGLYADRLFGLDMTFRLMIGAVAVVSLGLLFLRRTQLGREMFAIREDELAAQTLGIRSRRIVLGGFMVSAMIAGMFGGIHGLFLGSVLPDHFLVLRFSLVTLAIPLIGGLGTVSGPLIAGFTYAWLREQFQTSAPELHLVLLGAAITLIVIVAPSGVVPKLSRRLQPVLIRTIFRRGSTDSERT